MSDAMRSLSPEEAKTEKKRLDQEEQREHARLMDDYRNVMRDPSGIRVLRDILGYTNYRATPFDKHAGVMARRCGLMDVGNFTTARMAEADTELYCKLMIFNQETDTDSSGGSV